MRDDKLIEAMARAIHGATQRDGSWRGLDEDEQEMCRAEARAALAALQREHVIVPREPTEAMLSAYYPEYREEAADAYRTLIEQAAPQPEEAP